MEKLKYTRVEECCEILDSMRIPITASDRKEGKYQYYGANGIQYYVNDYIFDDDLVLLAEDGGNFGSKEKPIAYRVSGKCWVNNHAHVLKFDSYEMRRYVEIYLNSIDLSKFVSGGAQPKLNQENLNMIEIPVPQDELLKRIVHILDRFEALTTDIAHGLPAEIEARRKQYEYYRDKLLTFKERKR